MRSGHNANHGGAFRPPSAPTRSWPSARLRRAAAGGDAGGRRLRPVDDGADHALLRRRRAHARARRRDRLHAPGPRRQRRAVAHRRRARGREVRFAEPDRETLELPAAAVEAVLSRAHALGRGHRRVQRGRHDPRPAGHRRRRPRRGRARLRRRRARHAAPRDRRRRAGLRRAGVLGLQVVRAAHRDPVGAPRAAGRPDARQAAPLAGHRARPLGARDAAVRVAGRRPRGRRLHASSSTARSCAPTRTGCWRRWSRASARSTA